MARLEKASITNTVTADRIPVSFNPEEYSLSKEINWAQAAVPGLSAPILQFVAGNLATLEMELMLDTADYPHVHEVVEGDTLATIAARVYEDPMLWRPIALRNGIDDPRALATATRLAVPPLPYRDPETGTVYGG